MNLDVKFDLKNCYIDSKLVTQLNKKRKSDYKKKKKKK